MRAAAALMAFGAAATAAQQLPASQKPFRSRTDLVTLNVTVLDGDRQPIRGLTADDFVILDGGELRPVKAFPAVELPGPAVSARPFADVAPDVTENAPAAGRLVAILLDRSIPFGWPTFAARRIARAAVDALGPGDRAAVLHTGVGRAQEFTKDRHRLMAAIEAPGVGLTLAQADPLSLQPEFETGECQCGVCTFEAITRVARAVEREPEREKLLLFIGEGLPVAVAAVHGDTCSVYVQPATHAMLDAVRRANLTIHALDPNGLNPPLSFRGQALTGALTGTPVPGAHGTQGIVDAPDALLALAALTGGRAVFNSNGPEHEVPAIFDESGAYYVIGFAPSSRGAPGTFRPLKLTVRRQGARVHTRSGYYVPGGPSDTSMAGDDQLADAIHDFLPRAGLQLWLDPLPFPSSTPSSDISFVLRLDRGDNHTSVPVEILGAVYDSSGRAVAVERHSTQPAGGTDVFEEVFTLHVPLPGAYQVRLAALDDGRTGSVYAFADVPDFRRAPVSLSGVGIHLGDPRTERADHAQTDAQPEATTPTLTVARTFKHTDRPAAVAYVCQSTESALKPVKTSGTVFNATGRSVLRRVDTLQPASFATAGCASYQIGLPLDRLGPGEYVLTIDASRGADDASRSVRFRVE
jgi:VWFA-related protein